jgi:hypothetical protein
MYIDHRTYTFHPTTMPKWIALYEQYGLPVQQKYLGNLLGFFQTEIGSLNQVIHLWGFDDLNERQRRRAEMAKDPAWHEFMRRNEELGALMNQESKIVIPVGFSPIR